ncbi:hypothetical protein RCOM_0687690 [Ricinus communis]|uniref:Uncharacterized protein n=1 Tax=Ricinus communis TaxID=3988 RepID=B9S481_RICCO|nr:hypothetical protein RCOM_0687690 [Ricinus communis]
MGLVMPDGPPLGAALLEKAELLVNKLQYSVPCRVGILLDKGLNEWNAHHLPCNIAVIFLGGNDDREALALASRMSSNPDASVTWLRIKVIKDNKMDEIENQVDELLIQVS